MNEERAVVQSKAMKMLIEFQNHLAGARAGSIEQVRDMRFIQAASTLLEFYDEKKVRGWLNSPCLCEACRKLPERPPRLDLLNSAYGFAHLMGDINWLRSRAIPLQKNDRVVRLETGEKGTVRQQFADGSVSLMLDGGVPADLDAASLRKIVE